MSAADAHAGMTVRLDPTSALLLRLVAAAHTTTPEQFVTRLIAAAADRAGIRKLADAGGRLAKSGTAGGRGNA